MPEHDLITIEAKAEIVHSSNWDLHFFSNLFQLRPKRSTQLCANWNEGNPVKGLIHSCHLASFWEMRGGSYIKKWVSDLKDTHPGSIIADDDVLRGSHSATVGGAQFSIVHLFIAGLPFLEDQWTWRCRAHPRPTHWSVLIPRSPQCAWDNRDLSNPNPLPSSCSWHASIVNTIAGICSRSTVARFLQVPLER